MCYNCSICQRTSKPHQSKRVWYVYRYVPIPEHQRTEGKPIVRQEIEKEIPVCEKCLQLLKDGVPLSILTRQRGRLKRVPACQSAPPRKQSVITFD